MVGIVHVNLRYRCPDWQRKYSSKVNPYLQVGFVLFCQFFRFIADKRELKTKTVVSDRVLSPNKT
ncbi:hypothetical protein ACEV8F_11880, partial [Vibrio parahaemolyticus]